jgi:hypothetical protein
MSPLHGTYSVCELIKWLQIWRVVPDVATEDPGLNADELSFTLGCWCRSLVERQPVVLKYFPYIPQHTFTGVHLVW